MTDVILLVLPGMPLAALQKPLRPLIFSVTVPIATKT